VATTTLDIFRLQPDVSDEAYRQSFDLEHEGDITLLDAILRLQDEQDGTLAVRYSCRSAICGSCACRANGKTVLACMSQVEDVKEEFDTDTIQVDPIGNFAPLKDLIVVPCSESTEGRRNPPIPGLGWAYLASLIFQTSTGCLNSDDS
jgi:succinate dehydrogenase / fumarate reductase iron-sulfur subunit